MPVAPAVIGVILGPEMETHFRRALQISQGNYSTFVTRPISLTIFIIAAILTPPDGLTQVMLAIPMWALYEIGLLWTRLLVRRKAVA